MLARLEPNKFGLVFLPALMAILVTGCYFWFLSLYAVNIPYADDIYDIIKPISELVEADSFDQAWKSIFTQHNDHRTMASRLAYYSIYQVEGEINFRTLVFAANSALLFLSALLFISLKNNSKRWLIFLPTALLIFQPKAYGIILWPMAAYAYHFVYVYGFLSLYCLVQTNTSKFIIAVIFAVLCTFTLASGQAVWLVGGACLLHQTWVLKQVTPRYFLIWVVSASAALMLYRVGFVSINSTSSLISSLLATPFGHFHYFIALLGSSLSFGSLGLSTIIGTFIFASVLVTTFCNLKTGLTAPEYACWFVLLSVAAMALGRAPYSAIDYALQSRYSFPSTVALATLWIAIAGRLKLGKLSILLPTCLLCATYNLASWRIYPDELYPFTYERWEAFNKGQYWSYGNPMKESNGIVRKAITDGLYSPPPRPITLPKQISLHPKIEVKPHNGPGT